MTITESQNNFAIQFQYNPNTIEDLKRFFPKKSWDPTNRVWLVPKYENNRVAEWAVKYNATFAGAVIEQKDYTNQPLPQLTADVSFLKRQPYPFQKEGIAYALDKKQLIIGDEPGLGKTGQSIVTIEVAQAFPCLIICPSSLRLNWKKEIEQDWTHHKALILNDRVKNTWWQYWNAGMFHYFIVNYESQKKYFVEKIVKEAEQKLTLKHVHFKDKIEIFKSVIIDESHRVKSTKTQQSKFAKGICKNKEWILALTGTPVVNKPKDLISQLGIINRIDDFGGYTGFVNTYCQGEKEASNLKQLNYELNLHCFYRREKKTVLKDLPAKVRQIVSCDISTRQEYAEAENSLEKYLSEYKNATDEQIQKSMKGEIMVRIGILKSIAARGKLNDLFEFIDDTIESGEKLGVFAHQHVIIDALKARYPSAYAFTGRETIEQRDHAVKQFQTNPDVKLIFLGIQAGGVGITLTAGSRCAFVEMGWHSAIMDQCEDRFHRIGQNDSVQCTYFLGKDTIDEWNYQLIESKREIASTITGSTEEVETNLIDNFINLFNQKQTVEA